VNLEELAYHPKKANAQLALWVRATRAEEEAKERKMKMNLKTLKDMPPWEWPEGAGKLFLSILRDVKAKKSDRLVAAELAGDYTVINDELACALVSILANSEESVEVRGQAAISLGPALEQADTYGFEDADDILISEDTFRSLQEELRRLYMDLDIPKEVRRRILEASARSPESWHENAVRVAYSSKDEDWKLTAVFCMRFVRGFDDQILESLDSKNPDIHYEAVCAAGNWGVDAAWPHIVALVSSKKTDKDLLLAAIEAVAIIRPEDASDVLVDLADSDDEDIVDAVNEALAMAEPWDDEDEDDDEDDDGDLRH
jgi:hypothetical protein